MTQTGVKALSVSYNEMLHKVQHYISKYYSDEIAALLDQSDNTQRETKMKAIVSRSLINLNFYSSADEKLPDIVSEIYEDMSGMSFLAKYLKHLDKYPELEEININAWNSVTLRLSGGRTVFTDDSFLSQKHASDIIRGIISQHGDTLDGAVPGVTSYIATNIRITAMVYPLIPKALGVVASIRITRPGSITESMLVKDGTVSPEIIEFLLYCIKYSVSSVIAGKMGSGKTTMLNYLLSRLPEEKRLFLIEEGSRELSLLKYNTQGKIINQVIPALTSPNENKQQNFDANKLLELGLRYDVDYFVPQEMRSSEAYAAQESARTGSTVVTTVHSNDAESTYSRIMTLMQLKSKQNEDTLMRLAVEAFPIVIYMAQLKDGTRRVMEVMEAESFVRGQGLTTRTIFRFTVDDNIYDKDGKATVKGHFEQVNGISKRLQRILLNNGAEKKVVDRYAMKKGA